MQFNELMQMSIFDLDGIELKFYECHERVMSYGKLASDSIFQLAKNLSEMKEKELYKAAGFTTFGEYSEKAVGLKERQAYKYAAIYENLPEEFLHSNAKIGISKLTLLASLSEDERKEITDNNDVEEVSVTELKKLIKEKDETIDRLQSDYDDLNNDFVELEKQDGKSEELQTEIEELKKELNYAVAEKDRIEKELTVEKQKPQEVVEKIIEKEVPDASAASKIFDLKKELEDRERSIKAAERQIEELEKKINTSSESLIKFKVKYNDLQSLSGEIITLLGIMDDEQNKKCKNALRAVVERWSL